MVIGSPLLEATGKSTITGTCSTANITWQMAINGGCYETSTVHGHSKWRLLVGHQLEMVDVHCHCWPGVFHSSDLTEIGMPG